MRPQSHPRRGWQEQQISSGTAANSSKQQQDSHAGVVVRHRVMLLEWMRATETL
jgi:hypothetical protein